MEEGARSDQYTLVPSVIRSLIRHLTNGSTQKAAGSPHCTQLILLIGRKTARGGGDSKLTKYRLVTTFILSVLLFLNEFNSDVCVCLFVRCVSVLAVYGKADLMSVLALLLCSIPLLC